MEGKSDYSLREEIFESKEAQSTPVMQPSMEAIKSKMDAELQSFASASSLPSSPKTTVKPSVLNHGSHLCQPVSGFLAQVGPKHKNSDPITKTPYQKKPGSGSQEMSDRSTPPSTSRVHADSQNQNDALEFKLTYKKLFRPIPLINQEFSSHAVSQFYHHHTTGVWQFYSHVLQHFVTTIALPLVLVALCCHAYWIYWAMNRAESHKIQDNLEVFVARDEHLSHLYVSVKSCVSHALTFMSLLALSAAVYSSRSHVLKGVQNRSNTKLANDLTTNILMKNFEHELSETKNGAPNASTRKCQQTHVSVWFLWTIFLVIISIATFDGHTSAYISKESGETHVYHEIFVFWIRISRHAVPIDGPFHQSVFKANDISIDSMMALHLAAVPASERQFTFDELVSMGMKGIRPSDDRNTWQQLADSKVQFIRAGFIFAFVVLMVPSVVPSWLETVKLSISALTVWMVAAFFSIRGAENSGVPDTMGILVSFVAFFLFASSMSASFLVGSALLFIETEKSKNSIRKDIFRWSFHEVRVPCSAILGGIELLVDDTTGMSSSQIETVHDIAIATRQLKVVLDNVLEWQRSSELGMSIVYHTFDPSSWLLDTTSMFSAVASRHGVAMHVQQASCMVKLSDSSFHIRADVQKLTHIILNMLSNALKHATSRVTCRLVLANIDETASPETFSLGGAPQTGQLNDSPMQCEGLLSELLQGAQDQNHASTISGPSRWFLLLQIMDDGMGMPISMMRNYQTEFHAAVSGKASARTHGTGLGAHIANKMILAHGGSMFVRSTTGKGTVLTVIIPVETDETQLAPEYYLQATELAQPGIRDCLLSGDDFFTSSETPSKCSGWVSLVRESQHSISHMGQSAICSSDRPAIAHSCSTGLNAGNEVQMPNLDTSAGIHPENQTNQSNIHVQPSTRKAASNKPKEVICVPGVVLADHKVAHVQTGLSNLPSEGNSFNIHNQTTNFVARDFESESAGAINQLRSATCKSSAGSGFTLMNLNVMLVEDDRMVARVCERMLTKKGAHVIVAVNGVDCIQKIASAYDIHPAIADYFILHKREAVERLNAAVEEMRNSNGAGPNAQVVKLPNLEVPVQVLSQLLASSPSHLARSRSVSLKSPTFSSDSPGYGAILLDMSMPKMNGLEAVQILKSWRSAGMFGRQQPYFVGATGNSFEEDIRQFEMEGADFVMTKPIDIQLLERALFEKYTQQKRLQSTVCSPSGEKLPSGSRDNGVSARVLKSAN